MVTDFIFCNAQEVLNPCPLHSVGTLFDGVYGLQGLFAPLVVLLACIGGCSPGRKLGANIGFGRVNLLFLARDECFGVFNEY